MLGNDYDDADSAQWIVGTWSTKQLFTQWIAVIEITIINKLWFMTNIGGYGELMCTSVHDKA